MGELLDLMGELHWAQFLVRFDLQLIRSETQGAPRKVGAFFGLLLFLNSLAGFRQARLLACVGILVSIPAMLLALLPTVAYN